MTQRKKLLLIIPFDEVINEFQTYSHLLWFYENGLRGMITNIIENLPVIHATPFSELNLSDLLTDLWGMDMVELTEVMLYQSLDGLDRCNVSVDDVNKDVIITRLFVHDLVSTIEKTLKEFFSYDQIWDTDTRFDPVWRGNKLILKILTNN